MVNKLLIQRNDTAFFIKEDMLDLKVVEDLLISNPMIAKLIFLELHKVF